jgi:glycosyltransferase involved in cell wall biosynthesis
MKMKNSLVSVVIPMYNAEKTLRNTVKSVVEQTYQNVEIIIIDDGSKDKSWRIANELREEYSNHKFELIQKKNGGVSSARNAGLRAAKGEYVALLDSDDRWLPDKLLLQMQEFDKDADVDFIGTTRNNEKFKNFFFKKITEVTPISAKLLLYKNFFAPSTVIFRRSILDETGFFDETQRYAEEGNYFIRICKDHKCVLINKNLVVAGDFKPDYGFSGLSSNLKEMEKGELKNLKDAFKLKIVGGLEYLFLVCYSIVKYLRRIVIVKMRTYAK